jgi:hypothetical protein
MPRISHKKASALSCVKLQAAPVTRLAEQVADDIACEIESCDGRKKFSCSVADAVERMLPMVSCPLQPDDLLRRCAELHLPATPPESQPSSNHEPEDAACVASCAAAYTIMWCLLLENVGDVVQRGVLSALARSRHRSAVLRAGCLVMLAVRLPEENDGEGDGLSALAGLPASIDLLLADEIGGKVLNALRGHVIELLSQCAGLVMYRRGGGKAVNAEISPAGDVPSPPFMCLKRAWAASCVQRCLLPVTATNLM